MLPCAISICETESTLSVISERRRFCDFEEEFEMESLTRASRMNLIFCRQINLLVLFLCLLCTLTAFAQTDLTGFWVFRVPTGDGNFRETFMDLKQNGGDVTGKILAGT